ncbi:MAG: hypothetical protein COB61_005845 [Thiotrichales bacterium]|nr:hypothetical protein [Thiotrichales bacterium]
MFNLTQFLKSYNKKLHWNHRIKNYIQSENKLLEFNKDKANYYSNVETAIAFIGAVSIARELKLNISNDLYKRRVLELKSEVINVPVATQKVSKSLENDHFNIYGVKNIHELAEHIIEDIKKVEVDEIKEVFKDYVYFFTYSYKYNSIRTHVATIRRAIRESDLSQEQKDMGVHEFKFSERVHDWLNAGGKQNRTSNMTEVLKPIEVSFLNDFVSKSKKYLDVKVNKANRKLVFTHVSTILALSIGRRLTELVSKSEFKKVSDYKIEVIGLAKKRHDEVATIIVPTLFLNADEVIRAVSVLRDILPSSLRVQEQRDKHAHNLADFKLIDKRLSVQGSKFASLRAMYAVVSELIYNQNNIIEENRKPQATFIQQLLGHGSEDFTTYQHYYKRQVLLKNFDLQSYLNTSKTAMI